MPVPGPIADAGVHEYSVSGITPRPPKIPYQPQPCSVANGTMESGGSQSHRGWGGGPRRLFRRDSSLMEVLKDKPDKEERKVTACTKGTKL